MNAPFDPPLIPRSDTVARDDSGERFTGRIIDRLAQLEKSIVFRLLSADPGKKIPPFLGLRAEALRKLVEEKPELVRKPVKVAKLLDQLKRYIELRGTLAHAHSTSMCDQSGRLHYVFETASLRLGAPWDARTVISAVELDLVQREVCSLVNQLRTLIEPASPPGEAKSHGQ